MKRLYRVLRRVHLWVSILLEMCHKNDIWTKVKIHLKSIFPKGQTSTQFWKYRFEGGLYVRHKKYFFRPLEASNGPITKQFELVGLQMVPSNPPILYSSSVIHVDHNRRSNFRTLSEITWFLMSLSFSFIYFSQNISKL